MAIIALCAATPNTGVKDQVPPLALDRRFAASRTLTTALPKVKIDR
jgi:hypothetical protein